MREVESHRLKPTTRKFMGALKQRAAAKRMLETKYAQHAQAAAQYEQMLKGVTEEIGEIMQQAPKDLVYDLTGQAEVRDE